MRRHVIGTFYSMAVAFIVLGYKPFEEIAQIECHVRIGVFLYHQRTRCVLDEYRKEAVRHSLFRQPVFYMFRERI